MKTQDLDTKIKEAGDLNEETQVKKRLSLERYKDEMNELLDYVQVEGTDKYVDIPKFESLCETLIVSIMSIDKGITKNDAIALSKYAIELARERQIDNQNLKTLVVDVPTRVYNEFVIATNEEYNHLMSLLYKN